MWTMETTINWSWGMQTSSVTVNNSTEFRQKTKSESHLRWMSTISQNASEGLQVNI